MTDRAFRDAALAGLVLVITGCLSSTAPGTEPQTITRNEETAMAERPSLPDQSLTVHLALVGKNGQSLALSEEPVLGRKALDYYQNPEATAQLIAWLEERGVQVRRVREAVTSLTISADKEVLEQLFDAPLSFQRDASGREKWTWERPVQIPHPIQNWVADAVLPVPPDFPRP